MKKNTLKNLTGPDDPKEILRALTEGEIDALVIQNEIHTLNEAQKSLATQALLSTLKESHETLHAIQQGEVDALMIEGQVYTLKGADHTYRRMVEEMQEGAITLSDGTILYSNRCFAQMLRLPMEQVMSVPLEIFVAEEDRLLLQALINKGFAGSSKGEISLIAGDGKKIPVQMAVNALQIGEVKAVCILVTDLTPQKIYEETKSQLTQEQRVRQELMLLNEKLLKSEEKLVLLSEELARSNKELEQFASMASHDLQEPLFAVISYLEIFKKQYGGKLDSKTDEFMEYALTGTKNMQTLIRDLLNYSRLHSSKGAFEIAELDTLFANALRNLQRPIQDSGVEIIKEPMPALACIPIQITQLFQNLIGNAIKFRSQDKKPEIRISCVQEKSEWVFSIRDNGIGFDPKHAKQIFSMFNRLHSKTAYPGSGIGLAICEKIVARHHGRIWVQSEPGKGSTFFFTVPWK